MLILARRRVVAVVLVAVAGAAGLAACTSSSNPVATTTAPRPTPSLSPTRTPAPTPPNDHQPATGAALNMIAVPALRITAPVDNFCLDANGEISPPSTDPLRTCLWNGGPQPGAASGTTMILGHVNYSGVDGALGRISALHAGDRVYTWNNARVRTVWQVTVIHQRPKADGIDPGSEVGVVGPRRLVMVTCGGAWIGGHFGYADLFWVYARPYQAAA